MSTPSEFLTTDWILSQFAADRPSACRQYVEFVYEGFDQPSPWDSLRGGVLLGDDEFVNRFQPRLTDKELLAEVPRSQRLAHRPDLDVLLADQVERPVAAHEAHVVWGYTLKEVASYWGIHYSTVSRMLR